MPPPPRGSASPRSRQGRSQPLLYEIAASVVKGYDQGQLYRSRILHVLWSPQTGPICAYEDPSLAWAHARTMLGVDVTGVEVRADLPEIVRQDVVSDYDGDEITPVAIDDIDDIDDTDDNTKE